MPIREGEDEPGSTRASREALSMPEPRTAPGPLAQPAPSARPLLSLHDVSATQAEDGEGGTIAATDPIAFDLDARRFPPRALDPVLHVGALRFVRYEHPQPGVLRFVAADRARLPRGVEVYVQYGDETSTRTIVLQALEVPR
jgi:hypothetical protein